MKYRGSAMVIAALTTYLLTACGGGGGGSPAAIPPATPPDAPAPKVTVTAPVEGATVGVPFSISWDASRATNCVADFSAETGIKVSVSQIENTAGTKIYSVTCTGLGGSTTDTAEVIVVAPSAEGLWSGTTANNRAIDGVVTREGAYWLLYSATGDPAMPAGFYAGSGTSTGTPSSGNLPSSDLREFNFEGGNAAAQGTLDATYSHPTDTYTAASTLVGSFTPVANPTLWNVSATGSENYAASGDLGIVYHGSWNSATGEGNLTGVGSIALYGLSADIAQTFKMTPATGKGVLRQASGATGTCLDTIGGGVCAGLVSNFKGALANNVSYAGGANNTTIGGTAFTAAAGNFVWSFLVDYQQVTDPDTGDVAHFYSPYDLNVNLSPQTLPSVAAGSFISNYHSLYEVAPSLSILTGIFTGAAGIENSTVAGASFAVANDGSVTGTAGVCQYSATIATHVSGGNVYDILSFNFTGGACTYTGMAFNGVARYDAGTKQIVVTATNSSRDKGFMFVGTKP
jgi:hypothetical protein